MTTSQRNLSTGTRAAVQWIPFQHQEKPQHHILRITQHWNGFLTIANYRQSFFPCQSSDLISAFCSELSTLSSHWWAAPQTLLGSSFLPCKTCYLLFPPEPHTCGISKKSTHLFRTDAACRVPDQNHVIWQLGGLRPSLYLSFLL